MSPRISIVTISFNQARYLGECIDSVAAQKGQDVEHVVVDPGSTDGSRALIAERGAGIDIVVDEPDDGPADGLNRGFARATGEVYGYINADDRLCPGALQYVRAFFERNPDVDVLCGAIRIINERSVPRFRARTADRFDPARYAAGICTVGQQATFFRRRAFERAGGFNPVNRVTWDGELLVDLFLAGARFATVRRVLGDFRIYAGSITGSPQTRQRAQSEMVRIAAKIREHGISPYGPMERSLRRLAYKLDPARHLGYLMVR